MCEEFYQHLTLSRIIRLLFNIPLNHKIYFTLWKVNEINEFFIIPILFKVEHSEFNMETETC